MSDLKLAEVAALDALRFVATRAAACGVVWALVRWEPHLGLHAAIGVGSWLISDLIAEVSP